MNQNNALDDPDNELVFHQDPTQECNCNNLFDWVEIDVYLI